MMMMMMMMMIIIIITITVQTGNQRAKKRMWNDHKKIAQMRLRL